MGSENDKKIILNLCKGQKKSLVISLVIMLIFVGVFIFGMTLTDKPLPEAVDLLNVDSANTHTKLKISLLTDAFATYKYDSGVITDRYYFASDGEYMYIVNLSSTDLKKCSDIVKYTYDEIDTQPEAVTVTGKSEKIPDALKKIALETYLGWYPESGVNDSNFEEFFGSCLLNTKELPSTESGSQAILAFSSVGIFITAIFVIIFGVYYLKSKKTVNKLVQDGILDRVVLNYNDPENVTMEKAKMIFTKEFLIYYGFSLTILEYKDIIWVYPYILKRNGFEQSRSIILCNRLGKKRTVCQLSSSRKNIELFEEVYANIAQRCKNALFGFTRENITATNRKNLAKTVEEIDMKNADL